MTHQIDAIDAVHGHSRKHFLHVLIFDKLLEAKVLFQFESLAEHNSLQVRILLAGNRRMNMPISFLI